MASWGDIEVYNEMISDLGTFCNELGEACQVMLSAVNTCMQVMENDKASLKACKNVALSCKKYEEAAGLAQKLAMALAEERDDVIAYLRTLDDLDD